MTVQQGFVIGILTGVVFMLWSFMLYAEGYKAGAKEEQ